MLRSNLCPHLKSLGVSLDLRRVIVLNPVFFDNLSYRRSQKSTSLSSPHMEGIMEFGIFFSFTFKLI